MAKKIKIKRENRFLSMFFSTLKDTAKNIERNNLMSFASVTSLVVSICILGIFLIISININNIAQNMRNSLEIKVFLTNDITTGQLSAIEEFFEENELITGYSFESKDKTLERYSERLEDYSGLLEGFNSSNNPVRDSYTVTVESPNDLETVKEQIEESDLAVSTVRYGEQYVNAIMVFSNVSRIVCLILLILLTVISEVIIYNTIKLTCYNNRKEIEIMKMIGAENWYVRLPFFIEGLVLGSFSALLSTFILLFLYIYLIGVTDVSAYLPLGTNLVNPSSVIYPIFYFSMIYGVVVASFGSLFSIRKYLQI